MEKKCCRFIFQWHALFSLLSTTLDYDIFFRRLQKTAPECELNVILNWYFLYFNVITTNILVMNLLITKPHSEGCGRMCIHRCLSVKIGRVPYSGGSILGPPYSDSPLYMGLHTVGKGGGGHYMDPPYSWWEFIVLLYGPPPPFCVLRTERLNYRRDSHWILFTTISVTAGSRQHDLISLQQNH